MKVYCTFLVEYYSVSASNKDDILKSYWKMQQDIVVSNTRNRIYGGIFCETKLCFQYINYWEFSVTGNSSKTHLLLISNGYSRSHNNDSIINNMNIIHRICHLGVKGKNPSALKLSTDVPGASIGFWLLLAKGSHLLL